MITPVIVSNRLLSMMILSDHRYSEIEYVAPGCILPLAAWTFDNPDLVNIVLFQLFVGIFLLCAPC